MLERILNMKSKKHDMGITESSNFSSFGNFAEIRRIQNKIFDLHLVEDYKSFMFTSPHDNCGTSTILSHVAFSLSKIMKNQILLVDFNSKNPTLHNIFESPKDVDVTDKFMNYSDIDDLVVNTKFPNIDLFSLVNLKGYKPGEFSYDLFIDFLCNAREIYDYILIDISALSAKNKNNIDPPSLSRLVDGVILVARWRVTPLKMLHLAKEELSGFNANILGVILNRFDEK